VTAANSGGTSAASTPSNAVTPSGAAVPGAPTAVAAAADTKSAVVSWTPPASDGGSAITSYTITPFIGTVAQTTTTVAGSAISARVSGLTNGTSYTFRVTARNGVGDSAASAPSDAIVPKYSIFDFGTPAVVDAGDSSSVNVGVKFTSDTAGVIRGLRFYKAAANTGTHVGSLWSSAGTLLAQATFTNESAFGWQTLTFSTPVSITASTTYVASYLAPNGHYPVTGAAFSTGSAENPPLHASADSLGGNGVYAYGGTTAFPTNSFNATNYWVDVLFDAGA
jgi:hypothetical protein